MNNKENPSSNHYIDLLNLSGCLNRSDLSGETGILCSEIALIALSAADREIPASGVLIRNEVGTLLREIACKAMDIQCGRDDDDPQEQVRSLQRRIEKVYCLLYGELPPEFSEQKLKTLQSACLDLTEPYDLTVPSAGLPAVINTADEAESLRLEIRLLREELSELLMERDHLRNYERRRIRAEFTAKFGELELRLSEATFRMRQAKRKLALLQAQVNRQEPVDLKSVEQTLKAEQEAFTFKWNITWEEIRRCAEEAARGKNAGTENGEPQSGTENGNGNSTESGTEDGVQDHNGKQNIKTVYRKIVKALHPDTHPDQSEREKELFKKAQTAYEDGELDTLAEILDVIDSGTDDMESESLLSTLREEKIRLLGLIAGVRAEIEKIRSEAPFTLLPLLNDPVRVEERKKDLTAEINRANQATKIYEEKIGAILNGNNGGHYAR